MSNINLNKIKIKKKPIYVVKKVNINCNGKNNLLGMGGMNYSNNKKRELDKTEMIKKRISKHFINNSVGVFKKNENFFLIETKQLYFSLKLKVHLHNINLIHTLKTLISYKSSFGFSKHFFNFK